FDDALEKRELRQQRVALETDVHTAPLLFDSGSLNEAEYSTGTVERRAVEDAENHTRRSAKSSLTGRGSLRVFCGLGVEMVDGLADVRHSFAREAALRSGSARASCGGCG